MLKVHSIETFWTQDGPWIRLVIFLQWCMFRCKYCHNPDTIAEENEAAMKWWDNEILTRLHNQESYFWENWWVTFSWWEPLYQAPWLLPIVRKIKKAGFHVCIDTNWFVQSEEAREILKLADLILPDIKHIDAEKCKELVWVSNENTLKTLDYLDEIKKPYWLRQVIVPWYTDDEDDIRKLWEYIKTRTSMERLELLPYHNMWVPKWEKLKWDYPLKGVPAATKDDLNRVKAILDEYSDKVFLRW